MKVGNKVKFDKVHINMVQHDRSALDFKHENVTKLKDTNCSETVYDYDCSQPDYNRNTHRDDNLKKLTVNMATSGE